MIDTYGYCIDLSKVTLQDCLDLYEKKGITTLIEDGGIVNFIKEE